MVSKRTICAKKEEVKEISKKEKMTSVGSPESSNSIDNNDDKVIIFKDSNVIIRDRISIVVLLLFYTLQGIRMGLC